MVRRGGNGVAALGDHAGAGDIRHDLLPGQMAADAGLGALSHLDLDGRACVEVILVHAEASRGHLHDGVRAVLVEVLVQSALAGIVIGAQGHRRPGQGLMGVVADGAVGHGGEHDGHLQLQLGRGVVDELTVFVPADALGPCAQVHAGLHGLTQGVDGWVGHLGSVDEQLIPVHGQGRGIAHGGEQHAAGLRLAVDFCHGLARPVHVVLEGVVSLDDFEGAGGAQGDAALAVDAGALVGNHQAQLLVVLVNLVGALALAHPAGDAAVLVADNLIGRVEKINSHQALPPSRVKITGWPPRGAQTCFTSGAMRRMAHSSLAT